jgi:cytochrome c peroxidase
MRNLAVVFFAAIVLPLLVPNLSSADLLESAKDTFTALPGKPVFKKENAFNKTKIELGKMLFFETRLSKSNVFSCNSCHNLATGGVDQTSFSTGHKWATGGRNAPTVLNSSLQIAQFWDGRAKDVEAQAQGPILADVEMAATKELALKRISSMPEYVSLFKKAFPGQAEPLTYENIANAIGAFERTLLTPSRFDDFLKGDTNALDEKEKKGLALFMDIGCSNCHDGVGGGGGSYQQFGALNQPKNLTDEGRYGVTKNEDDKYYFKVPLLRNIALTYPYFHDARTWNLSEAVRIMGWTQLGEKLTEDQVADIVSFLKSLTGRQPVVTIPILPPSRADTPQPDRN